MDNAPTGFWIPPPGASTEAPASSLQCEVWREEALKWCRETCSGNKPKGRDFNERCTRNLQDRGAGLAPEFPTAIQRPGQTGWTSVLQAAEQALDAGNIASPYVGMIDQWCGLVASYLGRRLYGSTLRSIMSGAATRAFGEGTRVGYVDQFTRSGSYEWKGPSDSLGEDQEEKYSTTAENQALGIVGHKCDTDGVLTPGGNCSCRGGVPTCEAG